MRKERINFIRIATIGGPIERRWRIDYIVDLFSFKKTIIEYKVNQTLEKRFEIESPLMVKEEEITSYCNKIRYIKKKECIICAPLSDVEVDIELETNNSKEFFKGNTFGANEYIDSITFDFIDKVFSDAYKYANENYIECKSLTK